jgi:hypothetical protein
VAGVLSLAICRPLIQTGTKCGELILGLAADWLHADNRLLYIARVTDKAWNGEYYTHGRFIGAR